MGLKKSLKNLVIQKGGTPTAKSYSGLINEALSADNPLWNLKLDVDVAADEDLLGKVIGDLQSAVSVDNNHGVVSGVSFYVDDYTGFSGDPDLQRGHYVVVHASVPDVDGVTITVSKDGGETTKALDSDGILIFRMTDPSVQKLTFTASKQSLVNVSKTYALKGMTLQK